MCFWAEKHAPYTRSNKATEYLRSYCLIYITKSRPKKAQKHTIVYWFFFYFLALKVCWKRKLVSICEDPVSGLMSVMSDYDRLLCDSPVLPYLHRLSVCGLFIRRILLGFEKLSFTEVSNFAAIFKQYCCDGLTILLEYQPEISSQSELSALVEFTQEMNKSIGKILTGQLISKCLFGVFKFFQKKRTKTSQPGVS